MPLHPASSIPMQARTMLLLLLICITTFTYSYASPLAGREAEAHPIEQHADVVGAIFSNALSSNVAYENLRILCETTQGRIAGSPEAAASTSHR